jgi:hypothetical protein
MAIYASTIFVSAFILFLVQPLMAKQILPWFGGSAAVWTTCMVFFQVALLVGYAYADASIRWLKPRAQVLVHISLVALSIATLPIVPDLAWKPAGDEDPTWRILGLLIATIGLPYLLLSTTGPLVQAWFARSFPDGTVYRLFALSNLGSLIALIGYPFLFEPWIATRLQTWIWSAAYGLFGVLVIAASLQSLRAARPSTEPAPAINPPRRVNSEASKGSHHSQPLAAPKLSDYISWLLLSALGSYLLLGISNHITINVASIPFLWLLPLTLYLVTFILCFEGRGWYSRKIFLLPLFALLVAMAWGLHAEGGVLPILIEIPLYSAGLFVCCMFAHGELAAMRPSPQFLTRFYLMLSLGGALGGLLVGIVAPKFFSGYWEVGIGLVAAALATLWLVRQSAVGVRGLALAVLIVCSTYVWLYVDSMVSGALQMSRNFYGSLRVKDEGSAADRDATRNLLHGVILHGKQYLHPDRRNELTTYYGPTAGIGRAIAAKQREGAVRVGVIGLGTGTLASWGRAGDVFRFYELDPDVLDVARRHFMFLNDSKAKIETVIGDARLQLEREPSQRFDVLTIDAFSSDSIPVHLITREALAIYSRHVKDDGIIAFHVTNRFLKLAPVVAELAREAGWVAIRVDDQPGEGSFNNTDWVLVTRQLSLLRDPAIAGATSPFERIPGLRTWTDDYSALFQVLK